MCTGLVIAVRYSASRPQFNNKLVRYMSFATPSDCAQCNRGISGQLRRVIKELLRFLQVLDYLTHQRLLFPALATTYAMHLSMNRLKVCPRASVIPACAATMRTVCWNGSKVVGSGDSIQPSAHDFVLTWNVFRAAAGQGQAAKGRQAGACAEQRPQGCSHMAPRGDPAGERHARSK
jgi:hypothetical protein